VLPEEAEGISGGGNGSVGLKHEHNNPKHATRRMDLALVMMPTV